MPKPLYLMGFSPTGTGRSVLRALGEGYGEPGAHYIDMSPRATGARGARIEPAGVETAATAGALAVVAPVYGGRLPPLVVEYLRSFAETRRHTGLPPVPVCAVVVYGNRAYDDALLELTDCLADGGFPVVAAAAFVGEHSYSGENTVTGEAFSIADGRPDRADLDAARALGERVRRIVTGAMPGGATASPVVPGTRPYRALPVLSAAAPITDADECILCGACEDACPLGIVSVTDRVDTDAAACIHCNACVKECPNGSRQVAGEAVLAVARRLARDHAEPRAVEVFAPEAAG